MFQALFYTRFKSITALSTLQQKSCYYPYFRDEETEAEESPNNVFVAGLGLNPSCPALESGLVTII